MQDTEIDEFISYCEGDMTGQNQPFADQKHERKSSKSPKSRSVRALNHDKLSPNLRSLMAEEERSTHTNRASLRTEEQSLRKEKRCA
jgi:hypothetical protein